MKEFTDLKNQFNTLVGEDVQVEIEGKKLELEMDPKDLGPLTSMNPEGEMGEEQSQKMIEMLRKILYRSYLPHYDKEADRIPDNLNEEERAENEDAKKFLNKLLLKYFVKIFTEISKELNWADEADLERIKRKGKNTESPAGR